MPLPFIVFMLLYNWLFKKPAEKSIKLPNGFLIGVASSAYQVEGAWNLSGKGESNWDHFVHAGRISDKSTGDVSTDNYHKYKEDIRLLKYMNVNHYRFSISWSRIFPLADVNFPNERGIRHYHNVLDELQKQGIIPVVTIYHWDHPQVLDDLGGWLNDSMAFIFADYAKFIFQEYGNRVKHFITVNEPRIYCKSAFGSNLFPPGTNLGDSAAYLCVQNMLKGHAIAYRTYDNIFRNQQNGQVGITVVCENYFSKYKNDSVAEDIAFDFDCGWQANAIFSATGDYPEVIKQRISERSKLLGLNTSRLPTLSKEWVEYIKGASDFFGLNSYTSMLVESLSEFPLISWPNDAGLIYSTDPKWPTAQTPWLKIVPEGIRFLLIKIKEKYDNPLVFITENGVSDRSGINDDFRINCLYSYMKEILTALEKDKCNVKMYTIWSFLDSFEWTSGYNASFGLVKVDFNDRNRKRTLKKSAKWLKKILASRELKPPNKLLNYNWKI